MKVTFFSNFLNHHQLSFCLEMQKYLGEGFKFVATEEIPDERIKLGYDDMNKSYDFVIRSYENEEEAYKLGLESDVVIIGSAPLKYIKKRLQSKKLTFYYSERIFKEGFNLKTWLALIKNHFIYENKNTFLLCSSAYTINDYNLAFSFINKGYKWGYFPEVKKYDLNKLMSNKKKFQIIWVGRLIPYKHPEKVIDLAKYLKELNYKFNILVVGIGEMYDYLKKEIDDNGLNKYVNLLGAVNNKEVRKYMEESQMFIFTSDKGEGWGAVLNEAMNSGCAVVANKDIGAVPYLVKDKINGSIYDNTSKDLCAKVLTLFQNKKLIDKYGQNAYKTICEEWNASNACQQLLKLSKALLNKEDNFIIKDGPCSKAKKIKL